MQDYHDFLAEVLFSQEQIARRVVELGAEISRDYQDGNLLLVCILRGGVMFLTDLMRAIDVPLAVEFMAVSSYGAGKRESTGQARITLDVEKEQARFKNPHLPNTRSEYARKDRRQCPQ